MNEPNKKITRRSDKYNKEELDNIKRNVKGKIQKDNQEEISNKIKNETTNEIKNQTNKETHSQSKVVSHEYAVHKNNLNNLKNNNKVNTNNNEVNRKKSGEMMKKRKSKKTKLDKNSLIFFGILFFVFLMIFLKTMGVTMAIATMLGILIIIECSILLKKIRKNKAVRIITNIFTILFLLGCIAGVCGVAYFGYIIVTEAPDWDTSKLNSKETTILYAADGTEYAELGTEKRELITYEETSENLINAIIATEDSRFFTHNGFDALRFLKAGVGQVLGNSDAGGASTLSMQVIKNRFTDANLVALNSSGIKRKFTDIYLAVFKLEKEYSKEAIFEFYINNHFLGNNAYGVEQAAITYFGKHASELTLPEAALIAGMFQAPTSYNPFLNPDAATERRNQVLNLMHNHGYITKEERDVAKSIPIESLLVEENSGETLAYQSYIDTVIEELIDKYDIDPYSTSLKVYTNINLNKQAGLDAIFNGETFKWENDVVQSGIAAVDVDTGKIIAIAGGRNTGARQLNRATGLNKQIGSTAKPIFDYAPAMEYSGYSTYTLIKDEKYYYSSGQEIRNSDRKHQGTITLRKALAESRNVPALKAFQAVDNEDIYNFVTSLGITPETSNNSTYLHEAHSIGAFNGSNPLEMAAAYAAFANGGIYYEPYTINKIVFRDTGETHDYESEGTRVMSEATAFMITYCLRTAVTDGLSSGAAIKGINVAAKTGTTNFTTQIAKAHNLPSYAVNDAWIAGYDPDTAVAMWYGYDKIYDGSTGYFLKSASSGYKVNVLTERNRLYTTAGKVLFSSKGKDFKVPNSVVKVGVEMGTDPAKLASSNTPSNKITYEYFAKGTEPTEVSTTYNKLANVSNLTAQYDIYTGNVNLSWSGVSTPSDYEDSYGAFGYRIYKDDSYLGFTEETAFTVTNQQDPAGTYKVITTFEDYSERDSSGATAKINAVDLDTSNYTANINAKKTLSINSTVDSCFISGTVNNSCVTLYKDGNQVTDGYSVTVTITDNDGDTVSVDTSYASSYVAIFKVEYNGKTRVTKSHSFEVK